MDRVDLEAGQRQDVLGMIGVVLQYNTENFYSASMLGVAKFKGASSQNPSNRKLNSRGKPYSSSRDWEIN